MLNETYQSRGRIGKGPAARCRKVAPRDFRRNPTACPGPRCSRRSASQGRRRRTPAGRGDGHCVRPDLLRALPLPAQPYLADGRPAHHPTAEWVPRPPPN